MSDLYRIIRLLEAACREYKTLLMALSEQLVWQHLLMKMQFALIALMLLTLGVLAFFDLWAERLQGFENWLKNRKYNKGEDSDGKQ